MIDRLKELSTQLVLMQREVERMIDELEFQPAAKPPRAVWIKVENIDRGMDMHTDRGWVSVEGVGRLNGLVIASLARHTLVMSFEPGRKVKVRKQNA